MLPHVLSERQADESPGRWVGMGGRAAGRRALGGPDAAAVHRYLQALFWDVERRLTGPGCWPSRPRFDDHYPDRTGQMPWPGPSSSIITISSLVSSIGNADRGHGCTKAVITLGPPERYANLLFPRHASFCTLHATPVAPVLPSSSTSTPPFPGPTAPPFCLHHPNRLRPCPLACSSAPADGCKRRLPCPAAPRSTCPTLVSLAAIASTLA